MLVPSEGERGVYYNLAVAARLKFLVVNDVEAQPDGEEHQVTKHRIVVLLPTGKETHINVSRYTYRKAERWAAAYVNGERQ